MNYRLSTGLIALGVSLVVGSSAVAAPGIAYKKRLNVPMVPSTIVQQAKKMAWAPIKDQKTPVFKEVTLYEEKDCGNTIYRSWVLPRDTNNAGLSYRLIVEGRTPTKTKWIVLPSEYTIVTGGIRSPLQEGLSDANIRFYSCRGQDLIIKTDSTSVKDNKLVRHVSLTPIRYASFDKQSEWTDRSRALAINDDHTKITKDYFVETPVSIDGIDQLAGVLHVENNVISGDSRPVTFDQKEAMHLHTMPHYRDLSSVSADTRLTAMFFRTKDGYAVFEWQHKTDTSENMTTYYRIRNGEARFSKVDKLPVKVASAIQQQTSGALVLMTNDDLETRLVSVHGLPPTGYIAHGNVLWDTETQAYVRYIITETKTGKQQYWEATVDKK